MKTVLWFLLALSLAARLCAQSTAPVRLALIAETPEATTACDLLTAEFSKNAGVELLERNQIDKAYREQTLSAANRDYLKLGQVLGADGLLLIRANPAANASSSPGASALMALQSKPKFDFGVRLIAVKPGVLLADEEFSAVEDVAQWTEGLTGHLNPLLPKTSVLVKDAVPVSIVNIRATIQSPETKELEHLLTSLTIERLSREKQLFVLERQKMQLLASEKELKSLGDSTFWNGSYLLDGTIDRNGYSAGKLTLSVRLNPPHGGAPVNIELSGNRTNLAEIVNQLAEKVCEQSKISAAMAWNPSEEAQQYLEEAKWALKWKLIEEAQNASDSAWALGKQDLECATVRVKAYLAELNNSLVKYQKSESSLSPGFSADNRPLGPPPTDAAVARMIQEQLKKFPFGALYREGRSVSHHGSSVFFSSADSQPREITIDRAMHVLELYYNFCRTHPEGQPQPGTTATGWRYPDWTRLGIEALTAASKVFRDYNFASELQKPVASKLSDLRALSRSTAELFVKSQSIREGYFVNDTMVTHDELYHTLQDQPNIFSCEVNWGCFWQEKPEETLELYRQLMSSAAFCYVHQDLWNRDVSQPRLVGWNDGDRKQLPQLWDGFMREMNGSTNILLQMEAKALEKADAKTDELAATAETNWWTIVRAHRAELVANPVDLLYLGWGFAYTQETRDMEREYWQKTVPARKNASAFEKQKKYLADFTPYDFSTFSQIFAGGNYTKAQAAELKPLVDAYRSNLLAHATNTDFRSAPQQAANWIKLSVEDRIDRMLNAKSETAPVQAVTHVPPPATSLAASTQTVAQLPQRSNVLMVTRFLPIPKDQLPARNITNLVIFSHRIRDDKLLLDLRYKDEWWEPMTNSWQHEIIYREAAVILKPGVGGWATIAFPHFENSIVNAGDFLEGNFGISGALGPKLYLELFENALYVSDRDAIRRYDMKRKEWSELPFPDQARAQLFAVNEHLYASSSEGIWEILDGGQSARILASTRRRPAASLLDSRESLGTPVLFPGKENALWAALHGEVFSWDGTDWKTVSTIPGLVTPEIYEHTAFFWAGQFPQTFDLWRLSPEDVEPVLCVHEVSKGPSQIFNNSPVPPLRDARPPRPLWKLSGETRVARSSVIMDGTSIYLMTIPVDGRTSWTSDTLMEDARHSLQPELVCFMPGVSVPLIVPIRFDPGAGPAPTLNRMAPGGSIWAECSSEFLFIGSSHSGVWALPKAAIRAELERQLKSLPPASQNTPTDESPEKVEKALLAKYDLNHNGKFDPEEQQAAINDPVFLKFNLDNIDTNRNGMLDVDELDYFDVNKNAKLDPSEEPALHAVQQILAAAAFKQFDRDENGRLDSQEFGEFSRGKISGPGFQSWQSASGGSEFEHIQSFLDVATRSKIEDRLSHMGIDPRTFFGFHPSQNDPTLLRREINLYWANRKPAR